MRSGVRLVSLYDLRADLSLVPLLSWNPLWGPLRNLELRSVASLGFAPPALAIASASVWVVVDLLRTAVAVDAILTEGFYPLYEAYLVLTFASATLAIVWSSKDRHSTPVVLLGGRMVLMSLEGLHP